MSDPNQRAIRVLITAFGPFAKWNENPAWLAVRPLHDTVVYSDPPTEPLLHHEHEAMITDQMEEMLTPHPVHITTLEIPLTYDAVHCTIPGLHARPPVLPRNKDQSLARIPPPPGGFDFIFHLGLAGRGPLRIEKVSHKTGYRMKDANGEYAPMMPVIPKDAKEDPNDPDRMAAMLGLSAPSNGVAIPGSPGNLDVPGQSRGEGGTDGVDHPPNRGFGKGYESFPDELQTDIDVAKLLNYLKENGIEVYSSMDAGHWIADFTFYCSLAESKRLAGKEGKFQDRTSTTKCTPVLFMHCGPPDQPLSTAEVTDAIRKVVAWVCGRLHTDLLRAPARRQALTDYRIRLS